MTQQPEQSAPAITYADAGVDTAAGDRAVALMKDAVASTMTPAVVGGVSDGTVWLPECSAGSTVHQTLGAGHGSQVTVTHAAEVLR